MTRLEAWYLCLLILTKVCLKFLLSVERILSSLATIDRIDYVLSFTDNTAKDGFFSVCEGPMFSFAKYDILLAEQFLSSFESYQNSKS